MIAELRELLTREGAPFEVISHREVYTAQERAATCHVPGRRFAKVVIVRDGAWYAMAVLPATAQLDLLELRRQTRRYALAMASEDDFAGLFPDCEIGAMPPFGRIFGLPVYLDLAFAAGDEIVFESGTHREEVRLPMAAYIRVERPAIAPLARVPLAA
jgi:Ala-tRNA(Pro) deacylase